MFRLFVTFSKIRSEPWYGKNAGLVEGLPTGLRHVELTRRHFLPIPGPVVAQRHTYATLNVSNEPQRACRCQDHTQRVGPDDALPLAALILPQPRKGVTVTDRNFHSPAVAIRAHDLVRAQSEVSSKKGFESRRWLALARLFGGGDAWTPQHHDSHEAPGQHRVPQAIPGVDLGPHFAGVGRPPRGGLGQRLGCADQGAFFAGSTALLGRAGWRDLVELGTDGEAPHEMDRLGQPTDIVLGGIATVSETLDGPPGQLLGHAIEDGTGQLTAGPIRDMQLVGLRFFEIKFETNRYAEVMTGPTRERYMHDTQNDVQALQRPVFLSGGAGAIAVAGEPCDMAASFFLGRIVAADPNDLSLWDKLGCQADDRPPELPALLVERAPEEHIEA